MLDMHKSDVIILILGVHFLQRDFLFCNYLERNRY